MFKGINGLPTIISFVSFGCLPLELENYIWGLKCAFGVELLELVHVVASPHGVQCCLICLMFCICSIVHVHAYLVCDAYMEYNTWTSQGRTKVVVFVISFVPLFPSSNKNLNSITTLVFLYLLSSSSTTTLVLLSLLSSNSSSNCCCFSHFLSSLRTWTQATLILFFSLLLCSLQPATTLVFLSSPPLELLPPWCFFLCSPLFKLLLQSFPFFLSLSLSYCHPNLSLSLLFSILSYFLP